MLGNLLPTWSVIPFAGILLSIALCPLINAHWWEHNMSKVSLFWAATFIIPFSMAFGLNDGVYQLLHIYVMDYIPFIILLFSLFVIAGGILVKGALRGTPLFNTLILAIGTVLASIVGTTGASIVLIRPLIRAIESRRVKVHTIVFFIFLVSNIGGSLTPVGDPPLFLGYLHGVPFFWTLNLLPAFLLNSFLLLGIYYWIDRRQYNKEMTDRDNRIACQENNKSTCDNDPIRIEGLANLVFIGGVILAVIVGGAVAKHSVFYDAAHNVARGIPLISSHGHILVLPYLNMIRDAFILVMALLSLKMTPKSLRANNLFSWAPIKEVAVLFAGIFITIIPALAILSAKGAQLGVTKPWQFFWSSGLLSSFLDNAPTYLTFLALGGQMSATGGIVTDMGMVSERVLLAISCGSVFMGANTYIGNAPNFMVRSIAEESGIRMPSFFGYMGWSIIVLIPIFLLNTVLFFW
ncbi:MAG TPA: sodium:proton antiporter [Negativicutes bacterium]|nr:sodium:proton antiporter [Negativicutes bacterium]